MQYNQTSTRHSALGALEREVLPLGQVMPNGWLADQLRIQANGLSGHIEEVWGSVGANNGWLGGEGENWERGPYYLDGLVPLAYLLEDEVLIARAQRWIDWSLGSQRADGFFGPPSNTDWWPRMVMLKVLTQYQEVTGDARVIPFMQRYFAYQSAHIDEQPLASWAAARGGENMLMLFWLYRRTGDAELIDLARRICAQTIDWTTLFRTWPYVRPMREYQDVLKFIRALHDIDPEARGKAVAAYQETGRYHTHHVVNLAMALKQPALVYLLSGDEAHLEAAREGIAQLLRYHGLSSGIFSGDEHLSGREPTQGTETCAVVEALYSLQQLMQIDAASIPLADWAEVLAYNTLPAAFTDDMWGHQYDQQPNQVLVSRAERAWYDNSDDANLFGLEPNFGCCTANYHQGWPKYVRNLWLRNAQGGLSAMCYGPCRVNTEVNGVPFEIVEETEYPFRERIHLMIHTSQPVELALELRIPCWCEGAQVHTSEGKARPASGSWHRISRVWREGDVVELYMPMEVRILHGLHNSASVRRGPLIYSLAPEVDWQTPDGDQPYDNRWAAPVSAWNYALVLDTAVPANSFQVSEHPLGRQVYERESPPVVLHARGSRVPGWQLEHNSAGTVPESPLPASTDTEEIELIPYGAAKLRITEFPWIQQEPDTWSGS
ncbi:MAG: hypothetical protein GXY52_02515 [Chloroflexi bacterium]|nr:hypothetical protein [Chloroflexota bacterium]